MDEDENEDDSSFLQFHPVVPVALVGPFLHHIQGKAQARSIRANQRSRSPVCLP